MAQLAGKGGSFALGNANYAFNSWTFGVKVEANNTDNFEGGGFKTNVGGMAGGSIRARGPFNQGAMAVTAGSSYAANCRVNSTIGLTGNFRITDIQVVTETGKAVEVEITGESNGTLDVAIS